MKKYNEHINWNLAGKIISGEASISEQDEFSNWLRKDNHNVMWSQIQNEIEQAEFVLTKEKIDINKAWQKVQIKTTRKKQSLNKYYVYSALAASILIIIGIFLFNPFIKNYNNFASIETHSAIEQLQLADGTFVDINRNSEFKYPELFKSKERTVNLKGEAFFNVAKDQEHPFIIKTKNIKIKVLGTSFNVKDYPEIAISEVTVKTGIVEVSALNDTARKVLLHVGEKATYNSQRNELIKSNNNNRNFMAWKTQEITFKKDKLINAIELLEDVYNIDIENKTPIDSATEITATFEKNTIDFILNTINKSHNLDLDYTIRE
ncbi:FecR family protein [Plebeiibacterium sediminum]|uniref:FecR family protein n=1 Tax=Plebeiibacterium sediminum TaxID=2992112 RepID=A0AAE3M5Z2_9BACT|nr:FecR family protein [Plebeiobacterium sediminum]MCW3787703.1 FecR family protein [Plebeiobacterium sediminum]